ncbi:MAG: hypothetical protein IJ965_03440, partial [Campylobacter sp.]|nr:hypothetical protein [Campylobacter sp.]
TIDCDYRGEIKVALINWGQEPFVIQNGERIHRWWSLSMSAWTGKCPVNCPIPNGELVDLDIREYK